jgi:cytochrome c5
MSFPLCVARVVLMALLLAGCDSRSHGAPQDYAALRPADHRLARLYETSCKACHANSTSGAPLVHDRDAWNPRVEKGMDVLTQHAALGFKAMPAGGQCTACTLEDDRALIRFMADRESAR